MKLHDLNWLQISAIADILDDSDLNIIEEVVLEKSNPKVENYLKTLG